MIVYVFNRNTNKRVEVFKHVISVQSLSKSFAIIMDDMKQEFYDKREYKLTVYSY